ncbi:3-dehydroquinate synthase [Bacillus sp. FJAT-44742]|uniref:3-dehydroquinate synthase n=1 Tax=Bacillus sp. FJAT-44742 TaxID=2014005 RepID=UPI000C24D78A|nr:3-dehydroquinate synthase [Bacillus sp. FJAT-44742]
MEPTLTIRSSSGEYPIWVGANIRKQAGMLLKDILSGKSKVLIVTDRKVGSVYLTEVSEAFAPFLPVETAVLPAGEETKSFTQYENLLTKALEKGLDRQSIIVALGGGVIGDIAGFMAATYMRGIPFIQMPTTLLAHDSSVGGKTGINHPLGKNMVGAFHQPKAVLYDTNTLLTLPDEEWRSGFAEMIKHAYISNQEFVELLKKKVQSISDLKSDQIKDLLTRSIQVKADIVQDDEKESGVRGYLNFGHTLGHAIEKNIGYGGLTHGEAVVIGILFSMKVSNALQLSAWDVESEEKWLEDLGYPVNKHKDLSHKELIETMKKDKKSSKGQIRMVLLPEPGKPMIAAVEEKVIQNVLADK